MSAPRTEIKIEDLPHWVRFDPQHQPKASGQIVNRCVSECGEYERVQDQNTQTTKYFAVHSGVES